MLTACECPNNCSFMSSSAVGHKTRISKDPNLLLNEITNFEESRFLRMQNQQVCSTPRSLDVMVVPEQADVHLGNARRPDAACQAIKIPVNCNIAT